MSNLLGLEEKKENVSSRWPDELGPNPELAVRIKRGANWFYAIAGFSLVNSLFFVFGANVAFLAGLGLTQLMDGVASVSMQGIGVSIIKVVAIVFGLALVAVFALIGYYSAKRFSGAFIIGIVIYILDGLLLLLLGAYLTAGFHAFALIFIIRGFLACRELNAYQALQSIRSPASPA
jgi:hypothetical protein